MKIIFLFLEEDFTDILADEKSLDSIADQYPDADFAVLVHGTKYAILRMTEDPDSDDLPAYLACRNEIINHMSIDSRTRILPN